MGKWKIKFFKNSLKNKNSKSLSNKKFILVLFFCPKNGGVVIVFSIGGPQELLRPSKKVQILDSWQYALKN